MGLIAAIIIIFAVLALIVYPPLIMLAIIVGVGVTIHYFATSKNSQGKGVAFVLLLVAAVIVVVAGMKFGGLGVVLAVVGLFLLFGLFQ